MKAKRVAAVAPAMKAMKAKRVAAPAMKAMKAKRVAAVAPSMKAMKAKRVAAAAPAMKAMKAKRVAAAAMKAMKAKRLGDGHEADGTRDSTWSWSSHDQFPPSAPRKSGRTLRGRAGGGELAIGMDLGTASGPHHHNSRKKGRSHQLAH